jgi:hypothetical protein
VQEFSTTDFSWHRTPEMKWLFRKANLSQIRVRRLVAGKIVGRGGWIAAQNRRSEVLFTRLLPFHHAEPRGVVDDAAGANRHSRGDAHVATQAGKTEIDLVETAVLFFENGDVGFPSDGKSS